MAAARRGDDLAFEQLYQRYQRRIAAYVHGMVKDHGRAEDITQEVFMSALRRMRETERPIVFKPWVYEIAKNACIDAFRRSRRAEEVSYDADEGLGAADHLKLVSNTPTPDDAIDTRQALDDLRGAFGGLSESHHDILVMRELEGLSYREIGERLGMSRPSVESTLFRARRRLSEEYEELASGKRCSRFQELIAQAAEVRLGARDERKMARHVSHCQACRRAAGLAGIDVAALAAGRGLREKIAAILPLPAFLKRRWFGGDGSLANLSASASQYAEPMAGWVKAAAVAATVAAAGAGAAAVSTTVDANPFGSAPAPAAKETGTTSAPSSGGPDRTSAPGVTTAATTGGSTREPGARTVGGASGGTGSNGSSAKGSGGGQGSSGPSAARPAADGVRKSVDGTVKTTSGAVTKTVNGVTKTVNGVTQTTNQVVNGTTGAVKKTVDRTTTTATGALNKTTSTATGTVDNTVKRTTDTAKKTTGAVTGTLDKVTNGATKPVSDTVNKTAGAATDTVNKTTGTVTGTANKTATTATGAVDKTVTGATGAVQTTATTATGAVKSTTDTVTGVTGGLLGGK